MTSLGWSTTPKLLLLKQIPSDNCINDAPIRENLEYVKVEKLESHCLSTVLTDVIVCSDLHHIQWFLVGFSRPIIAATTVAFSRHLTACDKAVYLVRR